MALPFSRLLIKVWDKLVLSWNNLGENQRDKAIAFCFMFNFAQPSCLHLDYIRCHNCCALLFVLGLSCQVCRLWITPFAMDVLIKAFAIEFVSAVRQNKMTRLVFLMRLWHLWSIAIAQRLFQLCPLKACAVNGRTYCRRPAFSVRHSIWFGLVLSFSWTVKSGWNCSVKSRWF